MKEVEELNAKLYGPKYCEHCKCVRPVITHKLQGSDTSKFENNILTVGFVGSRTCSVCYRTIEEKP